MNRDAIRALYIDAIARGQHARYNAEFDLGETWEDLPEPDRDVFLGTAADTVADLAEKGLLPTEVWTRSFEAFGGAAKRDRSFSTPWTSYDDQEVKS